MASYTTISQELLASGPAPVPHGLEIFATVLFGIAIAHTFLVKRFQHMALAFPEGSIGENFFHLLGEVEIVFGLWAGVLLSSMAVWIGYTDAIHYVESLKFTEPAFVFVIMAVAATQPVVQLAGGIISQLSRIVPLPRRLALYATCLTVGPLLGSFITEPAAMTVTALILKRHFFDRGLPERLMYLTLGVLFVNISIGGVLTHFAAPPVLMVAGTWGWGTGHMMAHFGWKAVIAVVINALLASFVARKGLGAEAVDAEEVPRTPLWLALVHVFFLAIIVATAHHPIVFLGAFLFFLGVATITKEHQEEIKVKESLLVGFFLAGLVVLGGLQRWWLEPLITQFSAFPLFAGTTFLTAFTDNAALTYLGVQVPGLGDDLKYALVAGAVAGGGLTVIANAPNPAGFTILRSSFGVEGISPVRLALAALAPTLIAMLCLWCLP